MIPILRKPMPQQVMGQGITPQYCQMKPAGGQSLTAPVKVQYVIQNDMLQSVMKRNGSQSIPLNSMLGNRIAL